MELGLHESLLTPHLRESIAGYGDRAVHANVDESDQAHVLARHLESLVFQVLSSTKDPERRLAITNDLIRHLERADNAVVSPASQLMRVDSPAEPGAKTYERVRPSTPLSEARRYAETAHPKGEGRHHRRDLGP